MLLDLALLVASQAQGSAPEPIPAISRTLAATPNPAILVSPDGSKLLLLEQPPLRPLAEVGTPELRLAGVRINPRNNALSRLRTFGTMVIQPLPSGDPRRIVVPWRARVGGALWSPQADHVAFTLIEEGGVSLWVADAGTGAIRMLSPPVLNGGFGQPCRWLPSGAALVCLRVAPNRPEQRIERDEPAKAMVLTTGVETPDLLQSPKDEELFSYYFTSQLMLVPLSGKARSLGSPAIYADLIPSPDGQYLLVESIERPFSYLLPWDHFPRKTAVLDLSGTVLRTLTEGAMGVAWQPDAPATLRWHEARERGGGDRDLPMQLEAPFTGSPAPLARSARLLLEQTPGRYLTRATPAGPQLLLSRDRRFGYVQGSLENERRFLDQVELATGRRTRLWSSEGPYYEEIVTFLNPESGTLLTRRESPSEPANYFVRKLRRARTAELTQVTHFSDPDPELARIGRQSISYRSPSGAPVSSTLYLPPDYAKSGGRIPVVVWVSAGVRSGLRFMDPRGPSHLFLALAGYAVLDGAPVASADSAAARLIRMGIADPARLAIGAQASEAFALAELLGHSHRFRAGIVRNGGGGGEQGAGGERELPRFSSAELKAPLLLVHGIPDDSTAAFPGDLERLYSALKQRGDTVRLVLIPGERHGYAALESVAEGIYEMISWLKRYL